MTFWMEFFLGNSELRALLDLTEHIHLLILYLKEDVSAVACYLMIYLMIDYLQ